MSIDYSFQLMHRRLRERYGMAAIERHEERIWRAVNARVVKLRAALALARGDAA